LPQKSGLNLQTNADLVVQRFYKFIVAFCLALCGPAVVAQDFSKKIPVVTINSSIPLIKYSIHPLRNSGPAFIIDPVREWPGQDVVTLKNRAVTGSISSRYYADNFGFMCKKELLLEKSTRVPLRFRLGSLEYSNALERGRPGNR
jgi:hypothetical protein